MTSFLQIWLSFQFDFKVKVIFIGHDLSLNNLFYVRLLGTATVPLKDLVKDSSHTMQADVNLLDGSNRMTQVSVCFVL